MTPSKKVVARTSSQLPLPSAPVIDRYGMHADSCECARCGLGYRPTRVERDHARRSFELAAQRRKEAEAKAAAGAGSPVNRAEDKHRRAHERQKAREQDATVYLQKLHAPVERPATQEELDELKREFGFKRRAPR